MISLRHLRDLAERFEPDLDLAVRPLRLRGAEHDTTASPLIMGVVNLSRDSTYRASIAPTTDAAVRRGLVLAAQGCAIVDVGAESTTARASRVGPAQQIDRLTPVVRELTAQGVAVSVECYDADVARAALDAGAAMINYTGRSGEQEVYDLVAEHDAALVLCYVPAATVRDPSDVVLDGDPVPYLLDHFSARIEVARAHGVSSLAVDPGIGFYYGNLVDPLVRLAYQTPLLAQSFRLRALGYPVCQALPHGVEIFEAEYRQGEAFFAVWALMAQVGILRTHEAAPVAAVLRSMRDLHVQDGD